MLIGHTCKKISDDPAYFYIFKRTKKIHLFHHCIRNTEFRQMEVKLFTYIVSINNKLNLYNTQHKLVLYIVVGCFIAYSNLVFIKSELQIKHYERFQ